MDIRDKEEIIKRYTERFVRHGGLVETLGSGSDAHQAIRYRVISEVGDLGGKNVLDVGCGFGGFFDYCRHFDEPMLYSGTDIVPALLDEARRRNPNEKFMLMDILEASEDIKYDYVVSSQAFNNRFHYSDNWEVMKKVIAKCFRIAKIGVAFDMMSTYVDFREDRLYYFDPLKVFDFCKSLTKRVMLRHDYPLFEFCIYLYPDFTGWHVDETEKK